MIASFSRFRWMRAGLGIALSLLVSFAALAQSNTNGNIGGDAAPDDKVQVSNLETGFKRETVVGKDGKYRLRALPTGTYSVIITRGETPVLNTTVNVRVGSTARPPTPPAADAPAQAADAPPSPNEG